MADPITQQQLIDAAADVDTIEQVVNGGDTSSVQTRLGRTLPTLAKIFRDINNSSLRAYQTFAALDADKANFLANTSAEVTNDSDAAKNGRYQWDGTTLTKSAYDPLNLAKAYADANRLFKPVALTAAADFNTLTDEGRTVVPTDVIAAACTNRPSANAGILDVALIGSGVLQKYRVFEFDLAYERQKLSGGTWTAWVQSASKDMVDTTAANTLQSAKDYVDNNPDSAAIAAAFTTVDGKNKFNPALALDGYYNPYSNGIDQAFANGITFGRQDVVAGNTYTLWLPTAQIALDPVLRCYDASGAFLGNHIAISTYPVPAVPPTGVVWSDSNHTVTFTIPVGSSVAKIAANTGLVSHTTAQFNDAVNSLQMEIGSSKTAYEPYVASVSKVLKEANLPYEYVRKTLADAQYATKTELAGYSSKADLPPALLERAKSTMVALDGTYAYIRTKWTSTLDLVQRVSYGTSTAFNNNVVNPYDVRTIPASTAASNTIAAYPSGTLIVSQVDDAAPCQYNFTYIGANHGASIVHQVTVTGHGKTTVDVGSRWTQGANTFTLMRIVDANTLWLLSQNVGTTYWSFVATSQAGLAFTHAAGATNTAGFTPSADTAGTQLYPAIRNQVRLIKLDGLTTVSASGVYYAEFVDIVNSYDICNPVSTIAYVQSQVGSATQPSFADPSISSDMRVVLTYRYASNGSLTVNQSYQCKAALRMNYLGGIQALPLSYAGKSLFQYVPKLNPIVGTLKTWNLSAVEDITTQVETLTFTTATWSDANNPPDRMAQIVKTGTVKNHGFVIGYGLQRGNSVPAVRKLGVAGDAGFLNASTRKMYPRLVTNSGFASSMAAVGDVITTVAYRCFYNFDALPNATVYTWYYDGDDIIVVFDIHESVTALTLPLPAWMQGKSATVVDASASFSLKTPTVIDDGLLVTVTGGYGFASIKLR